MKSWERLTRRQQLWLLDRQVEQIDRAIHMAISFAFQPKPTPNEARRMIERQAGLERNSLAPTKVSTVPLSKRESDAIERKMVFEPGSILPIHLVPPHEELSHPDLAGLRLWEARHPDDVGEIRIESIREVIRLACSLPGRTRTLLVRASGLRPATISRMTGSGTSSVPASAVRIMAHVLGLAPSCVGLDGAANAPHIAHRPDSEDASSEAVRHEAEPPESATSAQNDQGETTMRPDQQDEEILELRDPIDDADPNRYARIVTSADADFSRAGIICMRNPHGGSTLRIHGRMTARRFREISLALRIDPCDERPDDEAVVVDVCYVGDDEIVDSGYLALVAPRPRTRKSWWKRLLRA